MMADSRYLKIKKSPFLCSCSTSSNCNEIW